MPIWPIFFTEFGQTAFGQFFFWWGGGVFEPELVCARRGELVGPKGWGPGGVARTQKRLGTKDWGLEGLGSRTVGGPKFRAFFFSLPPEISIFLLSLEVFEAPGRSNVRVWSSLSCEAPAAPKPPGFHTTA